MAKKKTTARKTRQSAQSTAYPHRSSSTNSTANSKAPSNTSSPSPQPLDLVQGGRRKSAPRRSPSQNDPSKGIVFSFRIQNNPAMTMSVDIRKYDQQFGPLEETEKSQADSTVSTTVTSLEAGKAVPLALSHTNGRLESSSNSSSNSSSSGPLSPLSASSVLKVAGERWSSDPTSFRSSNIYDQSRNLLILHTRRPTLCSTTGAMAAVAVNPARVAQTSHSLSHGFHPYRSQRPLDSRSLSSSSMSSSLPSTPSLMHAGSSSSSVSSSPTSMPSSPTLLPSGSDTSLAKEDLCSVDSLPLPLDAITAQSTRFLNVRGMGGAAKGRRMQVIVV